MRDERAVAIVGAGAAGVLVAWHLRHRLPDAAVVAVGTGHAPGRGVAYSTTDAQHRMNVPVRRLSVDADGSGHLAEWLAAHGHDVGPDDYLPRGTYGAYLAAQLTATGTDVLDARVVSARPDGGTGWALGLADGRTLRARAVVLATGPPSGPGPVALPDHPRVIADPWVPDLADRAAAAGEVVVLGTGLTMVDVALTATAAGATVTALSRHGYVPRSHPVHREAPTEPFPLPAGPLTAAQVRRLVVVHCRTEPAGWPAAMDAARDRADAIWSRVPETEQAKLLRRGLSEWTVHRHRMAPPVAESFAGLLRTGRVRVERGTVRSVTATADDATVHTHDGRRRRTALVVSCTGPSSDVSRTTDPLLRHLLGTGAARVGPHRLGLAVDRCGQALGPHPGLYTVGLLRRGTLVETTAVPEIRAQAAELADLLAP